VSNKVTRTLSRIRESSLDKVPTIILDAARRGIGKLVRHKNIVYRLDRGAYAASAPVVRPPGFAVKRCERNTDIPSSFWPASARTEAPVEREHIDHGFANGGVFWIAYIGEHIAGFQWSVRGRFVKKYSVNLDPDDLVIYGAVTFNAFRGRGIHPATIRHIIENEATDDVDVYCDTAEWNVVAQRNIEKSGFRAIAVVSAF
jgi:RimJ/RimL family protein N-acetyltransferase